MDLTNSRILDPCDYLDTPPPMDMKIFDPEHFINRIDTLSKPSERLWELFVSTFKITHRDTHEAKYIQRSLMMGFFAGLLVGGIAKNPDSHREYQRKHNAAVFENRYIGNRHFWDTLVYDVIRKGSRTGLASGLLAGSATFIGLGSIAYRSKLYLPDWIVCFSLLGGLSRCWIGTRGIVAGSLMGCTAGLIGYGLAKSYELTTGEPIAKMRYIHHQMWHLDRENRLRALQIAAEDDFREAVRTAED